MKKEIWLICSVSTFDSWKTSKKDVLFAESSEEQAIETCEKFKERADNETYIKDCDIDYILEKIVLYD